MFNTPSLPQRSVVKRPSAIAFKVVFTLACLAPLVMVWAAIANQTWIILAIVAFIALYDLIRQFFTLFFAEQAARPQRSHRFDAPQSSESTPTLAVLIPAWNEQAAIPRTIDTVLQQSPQPEQIIVSDDGSTDETIAKLTVLYDLQFQGMMGRSRLHPNLYVLRKPHSGKADSLNQAIARAHTDVVLVLDADTQLFPGSLAALKQAFLRDPRLTVVGGVMSPRCLPRRGGRLFEFMQRYDYARMHLWRMAWTQLHSSLIVSGACSAFRRDTLMAIGGFNPESWTEDYEIMYRMQRHFHLHQQLCHVRVEPGLRVYTDAPNALVPFLRQRRRWAGGFIETMLRYREMVGNARYKLLGQLYLIHNTLTMPQQPFYAIAGILTGFILLNQGVVLPNLVIALIFGKGLVDVGMNIWSIRLCRRYCSQDVSVLGMFTETMTRPFLALPLSLISHTWGWVSCWYRRASW